MGVTDDPRMLTPLCAKLGIDVPVIQAPIGRVGGPELAAAVSNAGGLGMLGVTYLEPETVADHVGRTRALTDRPFGINVLLRWDQHARIDAALETGARIVSLFWADREPLAPYVDRCHQFDAVVMHTIGTANEAREARDLGVDVVVAQGADAGGHVWGSVGTMSLIPAVVDAVAPTPVSGCRRYRRRSWARCRIDPRGTGGLDGNRVRRRRRGAERRGLS